MENSSTAAGVRVTEPRYWYRLQGTVWFKALKAQRGMSTHRLTQELAQKAVETRYEDPDRVVAAYRKEHGLERGSRWQKPSHWSIPRTNI